MRKAHKQVAVFAWEVVQMKDKKAVDLSLDVGRVVLATVPCKVSQGLFPDELSVRVDLGPESLIAFVSNADVIVKEKVPQDRYIDGELVVNLVRELDETIMVTLPSDTLSRGPRVLLSKNLVRSMV